MSSKNNFYDEDERYNKDACDLDQEAFNLLKPLFEKYHALGYDYRAISHVISWAVRDLELEYIL